MGADIIGWLSSIILLATVTRQVMKQWKEGVRGVSKWLFVGQTVASLGFVLYSVFTRNAVFIVTNSALLVSAIAGLVIYRRSRRAGAAHA